MATYSGSFSKEWASTTWDGRPKNYEWSGWWSRSENTLTVTDMNIRINMANSQHSGSGSGSDSLYVTGWDSSVRVTFQFPPGGGRSTYWVSIPNTSISISAGSTSASFGIDIAGEASGWVTVYFDSWYTNPTGIAGSTNNSDGTEGKYNVSVSISGWGGTSAGYLIASQYSSRNPFGEWKAVHTSSRSTSMTFTTSSAVGSYLTWYPEAYNDAGMASFASAKYIMSPALSSSTFSPSNGSTITTAKLSRTGGLSKSSSESSAYIKKWRLMMKPTDSSSWYTVYDLEDGTTTKTYIFGSIGAEDSDSPFEINKNYDVRVSATNQYGGYDYNVTTLFKPTGVSGTASTPETKMFEVTPTVTAAGGTSQTGSGSIYEYKIKYSTDEQIVAEGGGDDTGWQPAGEAINVGSGTLEMNTEYYYKIYAKNSFGLVATSNMYSVKTKNLYPPVIESVEYSPASTGVSATVVLSATGGQLPSSATISSTQLQYYDTNGVWQTIATSTAAGPQITLTKTPWTCPFDGDATFRVLVTNDVGMTAMSDVLLHAPSGVTARYSQDDEIPSRIKIVASVASSGDADILSYTVVPQNPGAPTTEYQSSSTGPVTFYTKNEDFLHNSTATLNGYVLNEYGLRASLPESQVHFKKTWEATLIKNGNEKSITTGVMKKTSVCKNTAEMLLIKHSALAMITTGTNLKNKQLVFDTSRKLFYNGITGQINFSNGGKLVANFKNTSASAPSNYSLWLEKSGTKTYFFTDNEWQTGNIPYTFNNTNWIVSSISSNFKNSAAMRLTICRDPKLGE